MIGHAALHAFEVILHRAIQPHESGLATVVHVSLHPPIVGTNLLMKP
jgi:hypothetical protein